MSFENDFGEPAEAEPFNCAESFPIDIPGTLVERIGVVERSRAGALDRPPDGRLAGRADLLNFVGFLEKVIGTNCNTRSHSCQYMTYVVNFHYALAKKSYKNGRG